MTARHFFVHSAEHLRDVLEVLRGLDVSKKKPLEIIVKEPSRDKSHEQRKLFHAICAEAAPQLGLTPNETKQLIKSEFYGVETRSIGGKNYSFVQSSEESDREEYERLIAFALQFLAEQGIVIQFRQPA